MDWMDDESLLLIPYDLNQNALRSPPVEFAVEDSLPRSEVELAIGNSNDDFAAHDLSFVMGVPVIFARAVVFIAAYRFMRGELFEPTFVVFVQSALIVVDEDTCGYVHGIYKAQPFADAARCNRFLHLRRYMNKVHSRGDIKGQVFRVAFHSIPLADVAW